MLHNQSNPQISKRSKMDRGGKTMLNKANVLKYIFIKHEEINLPLPKCLLEKSFMWNKFFH